MSRPGPDHVQTRSRPGPERNRTEKAAERKGAAEGARGRGGGGSPKGEEQRTDEERGGGGPRRKAAEEGLGGREGVWSHRTIRASGEGRVRGAQGEAGGEGCSWVGRAYREDQ